LNLYLLRNFGLNPDFIQFTNDIYDAMIYVHDEIININLLKKKNSDEIIYLISYFSGTLMRSLLDEGYPLIKSNIY